MNHIVALSGGKDSVAMALRLVEVEPRDYLYVCTPTGNELHPMKRGVLEAPQ
jgi:tRNA(Ile)-lysidine synthase TilS/MesJ